MLFCNKCGKPNSDNAKYCIGCGGVLTVISQQKPSGLTDTQQQIAAGIRKKSLTITLLLAGIFVIGTATAVYFIFFNKDKKGPELKISENSVKKPDTLENSTASVPIASKPVPLKLETKETVLTISPNEVDEISKKIDDFYKAETEENVTGLLSYYRFPLERYYDLYNVGYDQLYKMVTEAYNGKLYYHHIDINWQYSSVQKLSTGDYKALLFAEYTSASQSEEDRKTQNLHLIIQMNNEYEITSIYKN